MKVFFSELCLIGGGIEDNVDRLVASGAENIELMLDGAGWNDFHLCKERIAETLSGKKVSYSVHAPLWNANLTSENSHLREAVMETFRQTIILSSMIRASHVVLHPGACADAHFDKAVARKRARESMLSLLDFNSEYGQLLLVENIGTLATSIFSQDEFVDFLEGFPAGIGYLVDIGHAFINGWSIEALLPALGDRLKALHVHDNDGEKDSHLPLGKGIIDWKGIFAAVKATGREIDIVLEYNIGTRLEEFAKGLSALEGYGSAN